MESLPRHRWRGDSGQVVDDASGVQCTVRRNAKFNCANVLKRLEFEGLPVSRTLDLRATVSGGDTLHYLDSHQVMTMRKSWVT